MFSAIAGWFRRLFGKKGGTSEKPRLDAGSLNLSREERRQVEAAIHRARRDNPKELSAQDSIPFERMYPDGICCVKDHYLTFGIEAESAKAAKLRLERIETDIINNFKQLSVAAAPMSGADRLRVMYDIFHMGENLPFRFSWDWLAPSGLSVKDFIAPSSFEFKNGRMFRMGRVHGAVSFVQILAPELNDRMLADFLDMESSLIVNLHVQSVDQTAAIKTIKRKITDLDRAKIEEQKKAVRAGYDMDIIPSDLATYGTEAKKLLQELQSRNSDFIYMLNQASGDRQILAKYLNISPHQLSYVTHSGEGEGLLFYGNVILPFVDRFPKDTELYRIMTTKPTEVSA